MNKLLTLALFLGASRAGETLDNIPMAEGVAATLDAPVSHPDFIGNSEKTFSVDLKRSISHQEVVKNHIFKH